MANISITDGAGIIVDTALRNLSLLGKTPGSVLKFLNDDVLHALDQPINSVQISTLSLGFSYEPSFPLSGGTASLTAGGSLTGEIDLYELGTGPSNPLFPKDQFGTVIEMGKNIYLALSFQLGLKAEADAEPGAFAVSLSGSVSANARLYLPFAPGPAGAYPTLRSSLATLLSSYTLPSSLRDFDGWPVGTVFVLDCPGAIGFAGSVDVLAAINPTVTPGVTSSAGPISISAGPTFTIQGSFTISGEFQTRFWKQDGNHVQVGYYKRRGTEFSVGYDAGAGINLSVFGFDVISKVYSLLGDDGKLDAEWLHANVDEAVAEKVSDAYTNAVQTKLSIAIADEVDNSEATAAAFSWRFQIHDPSGEAQAAFDAALKANLTPLLSQESPLPQGVAKVGSVFDRITDNKHTFTFNFLGLFDHASVKEAVLDLNTKVSEDGQLVMTDTAHLSRLAADATPFLKAAPLQKVFSEDCVATVGYAASVGHFKPTFEVTYSYYRYLTKASATDLSIFLETARTLLGTDHSGDWAEALGHGLRGVPASFLVTLTYKPDQAAALFLDSSGAPRAASEYERVGRIALLSTPGLDLNSAFKQALGNDKQWSALTDAGPPNSIYPLLGESASNPSVSAQVASGLIFHVKQWAPAMHSASVALKMVSDYVIANANADLLKDAAFARLRQTFASQLMSAIQKAESLFDDALGLETIFQAAKPTDQAVTITYRGLTRKY